MKNVSIPAGIERVVLMIRHSVAPKIGNDLNKTLTEGGVCLCHEVAPFYQNLVNSIAVTQGNPAFYCSPFPRSFTTAWEIFRAANIQPEEVLKVWASLLSINEGKWAKERLTAGKTEPELIREFLGNSSLMTKEFAEYHGKYSGFVRGNIGSDETKKARFVVATCHEAGISLAARGSLPTDQLGLANCEAVLFLVIGGAIVGAEKIMPEKQGRDTWPL